MPAIPPTMGRRRLGGVLKALREERNLTNEDARKFSGVSTAKLSRLETGHNVVYLKDIRAILDGYKVADDIRERVLALAAKAMEHSWWEEYGDVLPDDFDLYLSVEEAAASLLVFQTSVVHGLSQTEDYARAWIRAADPGMPNAELDRLVKLRMKRQAALTRDDDPVVLWAILDEAVVRRRVGGPTVLREQVKHLIDMCKLSNVTVQILPFDVGAHAAASGSFTLIEFAEPTDPEVGYVDCAAGNVYPEKPAQVRMMKTKFHHLTSTALTPDRSLTLLRRIVKELS